MTFVQFAVVYRHKSKFSDSVTMLGLEDHTETKTLLADRLRLEENDRVLENAKA
jgi:hypothetical protein